MKTKKYTVPVMIIASILVIGATVAFGGATNAEDRSTVIEEAIQTDIEGYEEVINGEQINFDDNISEDAFTPVSNYEDALGVEKQINISGYNEILEHQQLNFDETTIRSTNNAEIGGTVESDMEVAIQTDISDYREIVEQEQVDFNN